MIPDDRIAEERTMENETAHNGQSWFVLSFLSSLLFFFNAPLVLLHGSLDQKTKVQELSAENNIAVQEKCIHYIVDTLINECSRSLNQTIAFSFFQYIHEEPRILFLCTH